ncbi:MAG: hypothetical protein C6I00_06595 [Nitratiruptor sp.]|nr:hypothetical protein [Nitratiruptor sp.]NPA83704.1 hypothetical protein [Campylobacterota bacterium]
MFRVAITNKWGLNIFVLSGALNGILGKIPTIQPRLHTRVVEVPQALLLANRSFDSANKVELFYLFDPSLYRVV